jgi:cytoplasmic iron level regulating protein YaaA (DUF328/UPF0246 family)
MELTMLALVSPAKKLDFTNLASPIMHSQPDFLDRSQVLIKAARKLTRADLSRLMKLSDKLTELNFQRFKAFALPFTTANAKQAVLAFSGDTYVGFDAATLSEDDLVYAQGHLRILSGLYGLLRPLDLVQPYRLEMGSRMKNPQGSDLYDFWAGDLAEAIDRAVSDHKEPVVINLASNEYFKAARAKTMEARVITPIFKEVKDGEAKVLGMFAKRARGMMARFMVTKRIEDSEKLKKFNIGGYACSWVFTRKR